MKAKAETTIDVLKIATGRLNVCILGSTPLILYRMSMKAMKSLLAPTGKKTAVEKASTMKHDPMAEFLASPYTDPNPKAPTLLQHLSSAFKGAIKGAALDLPGANKSQIGRLTWVNGERISIYGIPQMLMSVTRNSDMNHTPDIRTRAIVPKWACQISVSFVQPNLREQAMANLIGSAGITQGIGDWRTGKGSGTYGQFEIVSDDNPEYVHLTKNCGRKQQEAAMRTPEYYDRETQELFEWFQVESQRRGFNVVA